MVNKSTAFLLLSLSIPVCQGCISDPVTVSSPGEVQILLRVTGGFAGADYTIRLDGEARALVGVSCVTLCEFENGEVIQSLTLEHVDHIWGLFRDADILALDGQDFGSQCCDQFYFDLDFRDGEGWSRVKGSFEVLPEKLKVAVATLQGMVSGNLPVIVDFDTSPERWPSDAYQIQEALVQGHELRVTLAYGGGCRIHDVKTVAWGGWMESNPVQTRLNRPFPRNEPPVCPWFPLPA